MTSVDGTNYPGPWQMRMFYTTQESGDTWQHICAMNMDVDSAPAAGADFADYDLKSREGLFYNAHTWAAAVAAAMAALLNTTANIYLAELWKYEEGTYNAAYQAAESLDVDGTSASNPVTDGQLIFSMRSQNGGIGYFEIFHSISGAGPTKSYGTSTALQQAVFDLLTDTSSPMLARDGGYLFSPLHLLAGVNERYFKIRNR